jgi:hypothetical protein
MKQRIGIRMDTVQPQFITWLSQGRIAVGKITMLDGDPGLGKSTLLMYLAARFSSGQPLPDGPKPPKDKRGVILICGEDDPADTIRPRLEAMGADLSQIILMTELPVTDDAGNDIAGERQLFGLPDHVETLREAIEGWGIGLVIIDPLMAFFGEDIKSNSDQDVRRALTPLATMLQETQTACILVRHLNKGSSANSLYRGGGSIGIIGIARFGLLVAKDPKDPERRVLAVTKSNLGRPAPSLGFELQSVPGQDVAKVNWLGEVEITADDLLGDTLLTEEQKADNDDADTFLLAELKDGPKRRETLIADAKKAGISARAIDRAKQRMGVRHERHGLHNGLSESFIVWSLPGVIVQFPHPNGAGVKE